MSAILFAIQAFDMIKSAVGAGMALKDVYDIIDQTNTSLQTMEDEKRGPTPEEWATLNEKSEELRAQRPAISEE